MTESHVDAQIAARIARVRAQQEARQQQRAELAEARQAGLKARHRAKVRRIYCGQCARPQRKGTYLRCVFGCGTALCRKSRRCVNDHARQCPNHTTPKEAA
ncbi:hypothetical protein [Streptomyces sp. NPDC002758]